MTRVRHWAPPCSSVPGRCPPALTVVGDVGDLEAPGAVGFAGFEVDPEFPRAGGEGDGPLVGLARLVGGDGGWGGCGGTARGPCDAECPSAELPSALLCSNAQGEEGHQGWGLPVSGKAEPPPTLTLHTWGVVIPSLL